MPQTINNRAIAAGGIGNVLEWYDFAVYGYLAPIIATQFFPTGDRVTSLIAAFGVFAAGYLMRPVGALLIGHIGDRMGRKPALTLSIVLMAIPTGLMALLPTHASIGVAAAVLLTGLRLLQGISVGGEYTGSAVFLVERAPKLRRGLVGSACSSSAIVGILLASGVVALLATLMPADALSDWGWRLAFVPGPIIGVVGYFLRRHIVEVTVAEARKRAQSIPILEALRVDGRAMLLVGLLSAAYGVLFYIAAVFLTTYFTDIVKEPRTVALDMNTAAMVLLAVLFPLFAALSDRAGRKPVMLAGGIGLAVLAYPLFLLIHSDDTTLEIVGDFSIVILLSAFGGPIAGLMVEMFPRRVRYSAVSVAYSLPMGVFGGSTPLVATWLIAVTGNDFSPAFYTMGAAVLAVIVLLFIDETHHLDLD